MRCAPHPYDEADPTGEEVTRWARPGTDFDELRSLLLTRAEQLLEEAHAEVRAVRIEARRIVTEARDQADEVWAAAVRSARDTAATVVAEVRAEAGAQSWAGASEAPRPPRSTDELPMAAAAVGRWTAKRLATIGLLVSLAADLAGLTLHAIAGMVLACLAAGLLISAVGDRTRDGTAGLLMVPVVQLLVASAPANASPGMRVAALGGAALLAMAVLVRSGLAPVPPLRLRPIDMLLVGVVTSLAPVAAGSAMLVAPTGQVLVAAAAAVVVEAAFRGFVQPPLMRLLGRAGGIGLTAALTGVTLGGDAASRALLAAISVLLGWWVSRRGLAGAAVAHGALAAVTAWIR